MILAVNSTWEDLPGVVGTSTPCRTFWYHMMVVGIDTVDVCFFKCIYLFLFASVILLTNSDVQELWTPFCLQTFSLPTRPHFLSRCLSHHQVCLSLSVCSSRLLPYSSPSSTVVLTCDKNAGKRWELEFSFPASFLLLSVVTVLPQHDLAPPLPLQLRLQPNPGSSSFHISPPLLSKLTSSFSTSLSSYFTCDSSAPAVDSIRLKWEMYCFRRSA